MKTKASDSPAYVLFGDEWKKEVKKLTKDQIVDMYALKGKECELLKDRISRAIKNTI